MSEQSHNKSGPGQVWTDHLKRHVDSWLRPNERRDAVREKALEEPEKPDEQYYRGYEGDCDVCGEPANRRWTWPDGYAEDRCSRHWISEDLPERGEHPGIARIEILG